MEENENLYRLYVGAYYGVLTMDDYPLKVYILKDIENYIKDFVLHHYIELDLKSVALDIEKKVSLDVKLHDALYLLNQMNAPMELVFLVQNKLKDLESDE